MTTPSEAPGQRQPATDGSVPRRCRRTIGVVLPALALALAAIVAGGWAVLAQERDAAAVLAERHAPVVFLKQQDEPCDDDGEPFLPAPVDVTFGSDDVLLRDIDGATPAATPVANPALFGSGEGAFVDLPGRPRERGCIYEQTFRERMGDRRPAIYAHVATEPGKPGLAVQYWFFYWFNDFNNVHEGDWEMVQLLFAADTAEQALGQEPVAVAYAQHEGGETAEWSDPKLEREGPRPVVYPSRGSHASYFGPAVWLGWGEGGSGFGCDDTGGPSVRVEPRVILVPEAGPAGPDDPFAWLAFPGRWGERGWGFFNGPTGPAFKERWDRPITWQEDRRASSFPLHAGTVVGPAATEVFCDVVGGLSQVFILSEPYPWLVGAAVALALVLLALAIARARPALAVAWPLYRRHFPLYATIGAALAPITLLASVVSWALAESAAAARLLPVTEDSPVVGAMQSSAVVAQQAILLLLVGPAAIWATAELLAGRFPRPRAAFAAAWRALPRTATSLPLSLGATVLLAVTLVGIPVALERAVRWAFVAHAAVLDDARGPAALRTSAAATRGRWWRLAFALPLLAFVGAALGPLLGILLMVFGRWPLDLANGAGAIVYGLTQPLALAATTALYLRAQPREARAASANVAPEQDGPGVGTAPQPEPTPA